jgi:uncharacterized protein YjbI with pentapeptide repeats
MPAKLELRPDCERCFGLCCVAPEFAASADFAIDKPAEQPCPNLRPDFRCGIHATLRQRGFPGCAAYDCFGAGQHVAQVTFGGQDWRRAPGTAKRMFATFTLMRQLHELLWYLTEALTLRPARPLHAELGAALERTERLTGSGPDALLELDLAAHRRDAGGSLAIDHAGADLIGADLRRSDLRGANLRGAYLIGANLRAADLRRADLMGADLRGADLGGADLGGSIFVTQAQLETARGDARARLPKRLTRPAHWSPSARRRVDPTPRRSTP